MITDYGESIWIVTWNVHDDNIVVPHCIAHSTEREAIKWYNDMVDLGCYDVFMYEGHKVTVDQTAFLFAKPL